MAKVKAVPGLTVCAWLLVIVFFLVNRVQAEAGQVDGRAAPQTGTASQSQTPVVNSVGAGLLPDSRGQPSASVSGFSVSGSDRNTSAETNMTSKPAAASMIKGPPLDTSSAVLNMMLGLFAIVLLIMVIAWAMRRFTHLPGYTGGQIKLTGTLAMGTRERIALVEVGDKAILLGVTPQNINTLYVFDRDEIPEQDARSDFAAKLQRMLTKGNSA